MKIFKNLFSSLDRRISATSTKRYTRYLRRKGVRIGQFSPIRPTITIDLTRPCLIEIGNYCHISNGVSLLTHGFDLAVLREKYGEYLCSSGKIVLEDNVFIGANAIVLKGVTIGKNSIVGAGSLVTRDVPPESVAAGNPCKVITSLEKYYEKRKSLYKEEAKKYALEKYFATGKVPVPEDFWEEFPLFLPRNGNWGKIPVAKQMATAMSQFLKSKPVYDSFQDFLIDSGIPRDVVYSNKGRSNSKAS
jgi:acetyltransferase-like isoleucine patch superfamily enzyme